MLGTGLGHSVSSPKFGLSRVGTGFPSWVSSPQFGGRWVGLGSGVAGSSPGSGVIRPVGFFIYFSNISLVREKPVPASQQAPAFHLLASV